MPGLIGAVGKSRAGLEDFLKQIEEARKYTIERLATEDFLLARVSSGASDILSPPCQPVWDGSGQYAILVDGYLTTEDHSPTLSSIADCELTFDVRRFVSASLHRCIPHSPTLNFSLLLAAYRDSPEKLVRAIRSGIFNLVIYDSAQRQLVFINDRFGVNPLYYHQGAEFTFAYNLHSLLQISRISPMPDGTGLAELLSIGYPLGQRSPVAGVRLMPPGAIMIYKLVEGALSIRSYDKPAYRRDERKGVEDCIDEVAERFECACRGLNFSTEKMCIMLSAGCDSRLALAAWPEKSNIFTLSYGDRHSPELRIAERLAQVADVEHHTLDLGADLFEDNYAEMFKEVGLLRYPQRLPAARRMAEVGAKLAVDGIGGDVALGGLFFDLDARRWTVASGLSRRPADLKPDEEADLVESIFKHLVSGNRLVKQRFLSDDMLARITKEEENIKSDIEQELAAVREQSGTVADLVSLMKLNNRTRRAVSLQGVLMRGYVEMVYPFLDYDFFDFCRRLPLRLIADHKLYMAVFRQRYKDYGAVAYGKSLIPINWPSWAHRLSRRPVKLVESLRRKAAAVVGSEAAMGPSIAWDNWDRWMRFSESFNRVLMQILSRADGVVDHRKAMETIESYRKREISFTGTSMFSLLAFLLWIRELEVGTKE